MQVKSRRLTIAINIAGLIKVVLGSIPQTPVTNVCFKNSFKLGRLTPI